MQSRIAISLLPIIVPFFDKPGKALHVSHYVSSTFIEDSAMYGASFGHNQELRDFSFSACVAVQKT